MNCRNASDSKKGYVDRDAGADQPKLKSGADKPANATVALGSRSMQIVPLLVIRRLASVTTTTGATMPKRTNFAVVVCVSALFGLAGASVAKDTPKRDACFNACTATYVECCRHGDFATCHGRCYSESNRCADRCRQIYD